jgi:hypothetical protein
MTSLLYTYAGVCNKYPCMVEIFSLFIDQRISSSIISPISPVFLSNIFGNNFVMIFIFSAKLFFLINLPITSSESPYAAAVSNVSIQFLYAYFKIFIASSSLGFPDLLLIP